MAEYLVREETLAGLADKIRVLKGITEPMSLDDMETELGTVDNAVTAALSALVEKGVEVPEGTNVTGLAELIAAIEAGGGDVVLGEITITSNENVTLTDAFPVRSQAPKAYFWFEKGLLFSDTTHTKYRPLAAIAARTDGGTGIDTSGTYVGAYVQTSSGSNYYSADKINSTNMFNAGSAATYANYAIMKGNYRTGTLYFGVKSNKYGFIEGRTYVWGVIPWDE